MLNFRTIGGAEFNYCLDFSDHEVGNISFFRENRKDILFHLSMRSKIGLAVVNSRAEGLWSGEVSKKVNFEATENQISITYDGDRISVRLNNHAIFDFAGKYKDINDIHFANFRGAVSAETVSMKGSANKRTDGTGLIQYSSNFVVEGWAIDRTTTTQQPRLTLEGHSGQLDLLLVSKPEVAHVHNLKTPWIGFRCALPGWIWTIGGGAKAVTLQAFGNDRICGEVLQISREMIIETIETLAEKNTPKLSTVPALLAVEHVKFGNLLPLLSQGARDYIFRTAAIYGVQEFLFGDDQTEIDGFLSEEPDAPITDDPRLIASATARKIYSDLINLADSDLVDQIEKHGSDPGISTLARQYLMLRLTEQFCDKGNFETLFEIAARHGLHQFDNTVIPARLMPKLPFNCMNSDFESLQENLGALRANDSRAIPSSVLNWVISHILEKDRLENITNIESLVSLCLDFGVRISEAYWQASTETMLQVALQLLRAKDRFSNKMSVQIVRYVLTCHGLTPRFWALMASEVEFGALKMIGDLATGAKAFRQIRAYVENGEGEPESALDFFDQFDSIDSVRFRQELELSHISQTNIPSTDIALARMKPVSGLDSMRKLAFPGQVETDAQTAHYVRQAIYDLNDRVDKSPYYGLQLSSAREIFRLMRDIEKTDEETQLSKWIALEPKLRRLSDSRSGFIGIGMAIDLLSAAIRAGLDSLGEEILRGISAFNSALSPEDLEALQSSQAAHNSLDALAADDSPIAKSVLALFPARQSAAKIGTKSSDQRTPTIFNTIVTVFSCRAYLDSRIKTLRKTWLKDLKKLGIPYVIIVGDGKGYHKDDIVYLDAPDDYEGLPQKTMKTVEWVYRNTDYAHMLKIDDDCFLNVEEYFFSQSYRKFDYYGRVVSGPLGSMDRCWHQSKSSTQRGQRQLDKSPEPARYADGGSAYALSRRAMGAIMKARKSDVGRRLISNSFMEDKLIGDLLATEGIQVSNEDYMTAICRRLFGDAKPVMLWENSFLPSAASPCKMVHLDHLSKQSPTHAALESSNLQPKKLWPTFQQLRLGYNSNQLELLSSEQQLARVNGEPLSVVCVCKDEIYLLPGFLEHYRGLGVLSFIFVDNCSIDGSREFLLDQSDCAVFSADTAWGQAASGTAWQQTVLANLRLGKWTLLADADEFAVYQERGKIALADLIESPAYAEIDAIGLHRVDMYPQGKLDTADFSAQSPFDVSSFTDGIADASADAQLTAGADYGDITTPTSTNSRGPRVVLDLLNTNPGFACQAVTAQ